METRIEIAEARRLPGGAHAYVVEVNDYEGEERVGQRSRTPFEFDKGTSEDEALAQMREDMSGYLDAPTKGRAQGVRLRHLEGKAL